MRLLIVLQRNYEGIRKNRALCVKVENGDLRLKRKLAGSDGMTIVIPDGYRGLQGSDGRMVPIPPNGPVS